MTTARTHRRRDSHRTRRALLLAAQELFGGQGYTRTTLRDIAERAGVDAALIARYFGNKTLLYIASLETDDPDDGVPPGKCRPVQELVERVIDRAASPVLQAAVTPSRDPRVQEAVRRVLTRYIVAPLRGQIDAAGLDRAALRAEVAAAALAGIALGRVAGAFEVLADASVDDVAELSQQLLDEIING